MMMLFKLCNFFQESLILMRSEGQEAAFTDGAVFGIFVASCIGLVAISCAAALLTAVCTRSLDRADAQVKYAKVICTC